MTGRVILKRDRKIYLGEMCRALDSVSGTREMEELLPDHLRWIDVPTSLGMLDYISVSAEFQSYCCETRFADPALAKSKLDCNPYSGKWNHYVDKEHGPATAARHMLITLGLVIPDLSWKVAA